jgi:hypothetical protein
LHRAQLGRQVGRTVKLEEVVVAGLGGQLLGVHDCVFEGRHDCEFVEVGFLQEVEKLEHDCHIKAHIGQEKIQTYVGIYVFEIVFCDGVVEERKVWESVGADGTAGLFIFTCVIW